jgi:hypothetical protein
VAVQLILNTGSSELTETGWGKTLSARQFEVDGALDKDLWREPITGALMLRPAPLAAEWRESGAFEGYKLDTAAFHLKPDFWETIYTKEGPADPFLSTIYPAGLSVDLVDLGTAVDLEGLTTSYGGNLVWALQTKTGLAVNQGVYLELRNFGFDFEKVSNYFALMLGQFALRLQTDGVAVLHKYDGSGWIPLQAMRFAGQSEQHGASMSLLVLPILGNRLHFYFSTGRAINAAFDHQRVPGPKDNYYSYRLPVEDEAWDDATGVWRVTDEAPLRVAIAPGRRYFMQIGRVVYASGAKTAKLRHDDIGVPRSEGPELTLHMYLPGDSQFDYEVLDYSTGELFVAGEDTLPQAQVSLETSSNQAWSPELHAVTLDISPTISTVERDPVDVSEDVLTLHVRLHNEPGPQELEAEVRDPGDYSALREQAGTPCELSLGGVKLFEGEMVSFRAQEAPGPPVLRLRFRDGWHRLECVRLGSEISYDGRKHTDVDPDAIPVSPAVNDWRFAPKPADAPADVLRLLVEEFSGWRLRHDAGTWRYGPAPTSTTPARHVYLSTADYRASGFAETDRVRAYDFQLHLLPPEFNALYVYGADGTGGEVRRLMTIEYNTSSISDSESEDYVGRVLERHRSVSWAPTLATCSRVSRLLMDEHGRARRVCTFAAEWKPGFGPDAIFEVFDEGPASLGVFRIDEVEIEVRRDLPHLYVGRYVATRVAPAS